MPSDSAVIVTGPLARAVTFPYRSTVATAGLELRQVIGTPRRSTPSAWNALAVCASVTPVYRRPGSGVITTFAIAGHVTVTETLTLTVVSPAPPALATISYLPAARAFTWPPPIANAVRGPDTRIRAFGISFPCASYAVTFSGTISPAFITMLVGSTAIRATARALSDCCAAAGVAHQGADRMPTTAAASVTSREFCITFTNISRG